MQLQPARTVLVLLSSLFVAGAHPWYANNTALYRRAPCTSNQIGGWIPAEPEITCPLGNECSSNLCCDNGAGIAVCYVIPEDNGCDVGRQLECGSGWCRESVCRDRFKTYGYTEGQECKEGQNCQSGNCDYNTGTCGPSERCGTGFCPVSSGLCLDDVCERIHLWQGEKCKDSRQCDESPCHNLKCRIPKGEGGDCDESGDCADSSLTCENAVCTKTTEEKTEPGSVEDGGTCTDPVDCKSGVCTDALCAAKTDVPTKPDESTNPNQPTQPESPNAPDREVLEPIIITQTVNGQPQTVTRTAAAAVNTRATTSASARTSRSTSPANSASVQGGTPGWYFAGASLAVVGATFAYLL